MWIIFQNAADKFSFEERSQSVNKRKLFIDAYLYKIGLTKYQRKNLYKTYINFFKLIAYKVKKKIES